jgi:hypothetical protein
MRIDIALRRELTDGQTAAKVWMAVLHPAVGYPQQVILKVCPPAEDDDGSEPGRHSDAVELSRAFAQAHLVDLPYDPVPVGDGGWLMFQSLAGSNRRDLRSLAMLLDEVSGRADIGPRSHSADEVAELIKAIISSLLDDWTPTEGRSTDAHPSTVLDFLTDHVGDRAAPGGSIPTWIAKLEPTLIDRTCSWYAIRGTGRRLPNPYRLLVDPALTGDREVRALRGPSHGDLHPGNVLLLRGQHRLIDLSRFEPLHPLTFDPAHLLLSIANRHMSGLTAGERAALRQLLVRPEDQGSADRLPGWLSKAVFAVMGTLPRWVADRGFEAEWQEQMLLSLVGCGMLFFGRRTTRDEDRCWFLVLAAEAAEAYFGLDGSSFDPPPPDPDPPRRPDAPVGTESEDAVGPYHAVAVDRLAARPPQRRAPTLQKAIRDATDLLAARVEEQWDKAAWGRRLMDPQPMVLGWSRPERPVVGSLTAALAMARSEPGDPIGDQPPPTADELRSGTTDDLLQLWCGLRSVWLVIIGEAGAGKTSAAIRLTLNVLRYRRPLGDPERPGVAVPVILTPHDWDIGGEDVISWFERRLTTEHPHLRARFHSRSLAWHLVANGQVALVLDGLDDLPEDARAQAIDDMNRQRLFRVVVLSRSDEMVAAADDAHLRPAVAVELRSVDPEQAANYLSHCQTDPLQPAWARLIDHLPDNPTSPVAQALDSPLMVALLRDNYSRDDPVDELLDAERFADAESIKRHLLVHAVPHAYRRRLDPPGPQYDAPAAEQWLADMAASMTARSTRDLGWWQLCDLVPRRWRLAMTAVLSGLLAGVGFASFGSLNGLGVGGLLGGVLFGVTSTAFDGIVLRREAPGGRRRGHWRVGAGYFLAAATMGPLAGALLDGRHGCRIGLTVGVVVGLVTLVPVTLAVRSMGFDGRPAAAPDRPLTPEGSWRQDARYACTFGILLMVTVGSTLTVLATALGEPLGQVGPAIAGIGVAMALHVGVLSWPVKTMLACVVLRISGRGPLRPIRFLEDARRRDVLRSAGPVYQFRHARVQDVLAAQGRASSGGGGGAEEGGVRKSVGNERT